MDLWSLLLELVMLMAGAFVLGALAQRLRQSPIIGYLLAGTIIGPLLFNAEAVNQSAELGVALLLFSIGLEFSVQRLRQMGRMAFGGGSLQVLATMALITAVLFRPLGFSVALTIGAMAALSSTAVVMRVLVDRAEIDSIRGRSCLAILLLQDIAIVPLVLMVSFLGTGSTDTSIPWHIAKIGAAAAGLGVVLYLLLYHLVPRLLSSRGLFANRELTVLLAIAVGLGAAWSAHALGLSPALGAFLAGILLGESPFAAQIRTDIGSLRTIMVTLFFASVGMLAKPVWFVHHLHWILPVAGIIFAMKTIIVYVVGRLFGLDRRHSLATGITMAQIGEFSFVLVTVAFTGGILDRFAFDLMVSTTIVLMFAAPYMVAYGYGFADGVFALLSRKSQRRTDSDTDGQERETCAVIVVGLGPAGREVVRHLVDRQIDVEVIEINPRSQAMADQLGVRVHLGDATSEEILIHAGIKSAQMVVVTLPNPADSIRVVDLLSKVRPSMPVAVRCRYNRHVQDIQRAGAHIVIDEESVVGHTLAHEVSAFLIEADVTAMACRLSGKPLPVSGETDPLTVES